MRFKRNKGPITDQDLSDFADGQLPPARSRQVAAHLRANPADADRIHSYWLQEANLYRAFESAGQGAESEVLVDAVSRADTAGSLRTLSWAAALAAVMVTAGLVWEQYDGNETTLSPGEFTSAVLKTYSESRNDDQQDDPSVPSLADLDLKPVGTRTIRLDGHEVVEYRYKDDKGESVALYEMEAAADETGLFQIFERDDTRLVEWTMADKRYALVGNESASKLTHLAVQVRGNLITQPQDAVETLAGEVDRELNLNRDNGEPVMVQSPSNKQVYTEPLMVPQSTNEANGNSGNGMTGNGMNSINNVTPEVSAERVQRASSEM